MTLFSLSLSIYEICFVAIKSLYFGHKYSCGDILEGKKRQQKKKCLIVIKSPCFDHKCSCGDNDEEKMCCLEEKRTTKKLMWHLAT